MNENQSLHLLSNASRKLCLSKTYLLQQYKEIYKYNAPENISDNTLLLMVYSINLLDIYGISYDMSSMPVAEYTTSELPPSWSHEYNLNNATSNSTLYPHDKSPTNTVNPS